MKKLLSLVIIASMLLSLSFTTLASESAANEVVLPVIRQSEASESSDGAAQLQAVEDVDIYIDDVYSDDLYSSLTKNSTFNVTVKTDTLCDLRTKMTLSLLNSSGITVATQTSSRYHGDFSGIVYTLKMTSAVDEYEEYSVKFSYSGSYEISYPEEVYIYPCTNPVIKSVQVLDGDNGTFKIELENAAANTTYSLCYQDYETDERRILAGLHC